MNNAGLVTTMKTEITQPTIRIFFLLPQSRYLDNIDLGGILLKYRLPPQYNTMPCDSTIYNKSDVRYVFKIGVKYINSNGKCIAKKYYHNKM